MRHARCRLLERDATNRNVSKLDVALPCVAKGRRGADALGYLPLASPSTIAGLMSARQSSATGVALDLDQVSAELVQNSFPAGS